MKIGDLVALRQRLESALNEKQYHLLLVLDQEIKDCVQKAVLLLQEPLQNNHSDTSQLKNELETLMVVYREVVSRCEERSSQLKDECIALKNTKNGAVKYLDIASQL